MSTSLHTPTSDGVFAFFTGQARATVTPTTATEMDRPQGTVPAALIAFFESCDYEDAVRKAISLGGDADTLACIAGAVAEAHYGGVPSHIATPAIEALDDRLRNVVLQFCERYDIRAV